MKSFSITICSILISVIGFGQFMDNFSDGNFTASPPWNGNTSDFQVASGELQLNAPSVSSYKYLSTSSQAINTATWEFKVRMTFNPSSSNFSRIYLVSNTGNLNGGVNGYFVKIGGSDDEVSLYSQSGTSETKIIDGRNGVVNSSSVTVKVRVTRSPAGNWQLFSDTSSTFISEGTVTDNTHIQSMFFGVGCNFTSTRSDKFFFDDFIVTGTPFVDTIKPELDSVKIISSTQLSLVFSEPVDLSTSQTVSNYLVNNGIGNPSSTVRSATDFSKVTLTFSTPFTQGITYDLMVNSIDDIAGNTIIPASKNFVYFIPATANYRDVVINEIFPDPSPMIGLPDEEFIELYNSTSVKYINLKDWKITDGSSTSTLPSYILAPDSYVILFSSSTTGDFSLYTEKLGLPSFPSLNNSGDIIELKNNIGSQIDLVEYNLSSYQNITKDDGGWSLEQINPFSSCFKPSNWIASSNSNGGTPGAINSELDSTPDLEVPFVISSIVTSKSTIQIEFNKPIDTALFYSNLSISGGRFATSYSSVNAFGTKLLLTINPVMDTGIIYELQSDSLIDCEGNKNVILCEVVLANKNKAGSLIINEILFDPFAGEEDFVEFYNNSSNYVDLFGWSLGNDDNGLPGNLKTINQHYVVRPNDYVLITKDFNLIKSRYPAYSSTKFITIESLPTYSNEFGTVYILTPTNEESDKFEYREDYHFDLLRNTEGISLERIDFNRPTNDASNWHSAAEDIGFATPGLENSQYTPAEINQKTISVSPELFSPDNDGFEDILTISYSMPESGFTGNVSIYDTRGRLTKSLIKNQLLGIQGSFTWDGTTEKNTKARIGRYIILFEYFDLEGNVKTEKTTCVVGHKL